MELLLFSYPQIPVHYSLPLNNQFQNPDSDLDNLAHDSNSPTKSRATTVFYAYVFYNLWTMQRSQSFAFLPIRFDLIFPFWKRIGLDSLLSKCDS